MTFAQWKPYTAHRVSYSLVSKHCYRQAMYQRAGAPQDGLDGIARVQGLSVHAGIEDFVVYGDADRAVTVAITDLRFRVEAAGGEDGIQWDAPIRLTQGWWDKGWWDKGWYDKRTETWKREPGWGVKDGVTRWPGWGVKEGVVQMPRPYQGDEGNMPDLATAERITEWMVRAFATRFPGIRVTPYEKCPQCGYENEERLRDCPYCEKRLIGIERKERYALAPFGLGDWELTVVFDMEPDPIPIDQPRPEGWAAMLDIKVSGEPWTNKDTPTDRPLVWQDVSGKNFDKIEQALLYMQGKLELEGVLPESFAFLNIPRTGVQCRVTQMGPPDWENPREAPFIIEQVGYDPAAIQVIPVPYDEEAVLRTIEFRVGSMIAAIGANVFPPNTSGWWCSQKFCDYWSICPLGAAARGGMRAAEQPAEGAA